MLSEGLVALIAGSSSVNKWLVAGVKRSDSTNGIFPGMAPKEVSLPYIVYQQIAGSQDRTMQGSSALQHAIYQFKIYGDSQLAAKKTAQALKALLAGFIGTLTDPDSIRVEGMWLTHEIDLFEEIPHGILYGVVLTYDVVFFDITTSTGGNTP